MVYNWNQFAYLLAMMYCYIVFYYTLTPEILTELVLCPFFMDCAFVEMLSGSNAKLATAKWRKNEQTME